MKVRMLRIIQMMKMKEKRDTRRVLFILLYNLADHWKVDIILLKLANFTMVDTESRKNSAGVTSPLFGFVTMSKRFHIIDIHSHHLRKHTNTVVALKIVKSASHYTEAAIDEIKILQALAKHDPDNKKCVVYLIDSFEHRGPHGKRKSLFSFDIH